MRRRTEQGGIEAPEDVAFSIMRKEQIPIMFETRNRVFPAPPRCSSMKEPRIFIPVSRNAKVKALSPEGQFFRVDRLETLNCQKSERVLFLGQRAAFLKKIESIDE